MLQWPLTYYPNLLAQSPYLLYYKLLIKACLHMGRHRLICLSFAACAHLSNDLEGKLLHGVNLPPPRLPLRLLPLLLNLLRGQLGGLCKIMDNWAGSPMYQRNTKLQVVHLHTPHMLFIYFIYYISLFLSAFIYLFIYLSPFPLLLYLFLAVDLCLSIQVSLSCIYLH